MAYFDADFRAALVRQLKREPSLVEAAPTIQLRTFLLDIVASLPVPETRWVVVIDALDECGDKRHQQRLVDLLRECGQLRTHIVIFFTSRQEQVITRAMGGDELAPISVIETMDDLDSAQTTDDIEAYISAKVAEILRYEVGRTAPPRSEIKDLAFLSGGLFELAAIRLRQITSLNDHYPLDKSVHQILVKARSAADHNISLHATYSEIVDAAYQGLVEPERSLILERYRMITGTLVSLYESLPLTDLAALVGLDEADAKKALQPLASVIAISDSRPIHFYHSSFSDFLCAAPDHFSNSKSSQYTPEYHLDPTHSHMFLATRTLVVMNKHLHHNILNIPDLNIPIGDIPNLPRLLTERISGQLRYSCLHWGDHLRNAYTAECAELLVEWCYENVFFYLEALSLLGELASAVSQLDCARVWSTKVRRRRPSENRHAQERFQIREMDMVPFTDLLDDSRRLVQMFFPAITSRPGSLYCSTLPLMPSCSLRTLYSNNWRTEIHLLRGRPSAWSPLLWSLQDTVRSVLSLTYSRDGRHIVAQFVGRSEPRILYSSTGAQSYGQKMCAEEIRLMIRDHYLDDTLFSPSSFSDISRVTIWVDESGELEGVLSLPTRLLGCVALSANGQYIASWSHKDDAHPVSPVHIWSALTGEWTMVFNWHQDAVTQVVFFPDAARIASCGSDGALCIWSVSSGSLERVLSASGRPIRCLALSFDSQHLASGSDDGSVRIWSTETGALKLSIGGPNEGITSIVFSDNGRRLAAGTSHSSVYVWSTATGTLESVLREGGEKKILAVAFSPDGNNIASGADDGSLCVWSTTTVAEPEAIRERDASPSSSTLSLYSDPESSGHIRPHSTHSIAEADTCDTAIRAIALSPNGRRIITGSGSDDCLVRMWSAASGDLESAFIGHKGGVNGVAFSQFSGRIVSGSDDHSVRVWSAASGELERSLWGHLAVVNSVAISLNGQCVASCGTDSVRLWSVATGEMKVLLPKGGGDSVVFSSRLNDARIFCGSEGLRYIWTVDGSWIFSIDPEDDVEWRSRPERLLPTAVDGWLRVSGRVIWLPPYLRGPWLTAEGCVVTHSKDKKGLIIIRVQPEV